MIGTDILSIAGLAVCAVIGYVVVSRILGFVTRLLRPSVATQGKARTGQAGPNQQAHDEAARAENARRQEEARRREWDAAEESRRQRKANADEAARKKRDEQVRREQKSRERQEREDAVRSKARRERRPWYVVLDVREDASAADIKAAYRRKISDYHPDRMASLGDDFRVLAEERSKEINEAYQFIRQSRDA